MEIKVEISIGELLDKISILQIKSEKITDGDKLMHIKNELSSLSNSAKSINAFDDKFISQLVKVNSQLWEIEDDIRILESKEDFSQKFINLARSVYITNDKRFKIKSDINNQYNSAIKEQKSYKNYGKNNG